MCTVPTRAESTESNNHQKFYVFGSCSCNPSLIFLMIRARICSDILSACLCSVIAVIVLPNRCYGPFIFFPQVGFWTSHAKCAATAARGNTTVFTPVTAARDSSRGASAETGRTSANLALRWGLSPYFLHILFSLSSHSHRLELLQYLFKKKCWSWCLWRPNQARDTSNHKAS